MFKHAGLRALAVLAAGSFLVLVSGFVHGVTPAFATAPGPYVFSTLPAAGAQASIETTKIGLNANARAVLLKVVVEDSDGIATSGHSLRIAGPGVAPVTLTPVLTYVAGDTRAVLDAAHRGTAAAIPEGYYTATLSTTDKSGAVSTHTWTFFAGYTKPVVDLHVPTRDGVALLPNSAISANLAGPRSNIGSAIMKVDGVVVPAVLTKTSMRVNSLVWNPSPPLSDGVHTVDITVTNAAVPPLTNTYSWSFSSFSLQPSFTSLAPGDGAVVTPDSEGRISISALAQDFHGIASSGVTLLVTPSGASPFTVTPAVTPRFGGERRTVDVAATFPIGTQGGPVALTLSALDLSGNTASRSWTVQLPSTPPVIDAKSPSPSTASKHVEVSARARDFGSGINPASVVLSIDGTPVTHQASAVSDGYVVSHVGDFADNSTHTASLTVTNNAGGTTTESWTFSVHAPPVAGVFSPSQGTTFAYEDVPISVRFSEADDGVDPDSIVLTFDGEPIPHADVSASPGNPASVVDFSATVINVGGAGSIEHTVTATASDTRGYSTTTTWSFSVVPQTGQADMPVDTNQPCSSESCHDLLGDGTGTTDFKAWDKLHWIVGDAKGWGIPSTRVAHKYNCTVCHYMAYDSATRLYRPEPLIVDGIIPCKICHEILGQSTAPRGPHGGNGTPYDYRFQDHDDASKYANTSPSYGRDCLYCHQGPKGSQEVENYTNGQTTLAHDVVGDHRMDLPEGCEQCHSAVLTREHAVNREGTDRITGCEDCHASTRPEVIAEIRSYPALRYRFWGTADATYTNAPVSQPASPAAPFSVETTAFYEIPGERIVGGRVRLASSTLGTFAVQGYTDGAWTTIWSKTMGGASDGAPGGSGDPKAFPTYPSVTERFSCEPVEKVRIRYTPTAAGWHYVSANVDSWKLDGDTLGTCTDCHISSGHLHPSGLSADCESCHSADLVTEHGKHTGDDRKALSCASCHESTDLDVQAAIASNDMSCNACHKLVEAGGHLPMHDTAFDESSCDNCHDANLMTEHVAVRQKECGNCHIESATASASPDPATYQAVAFGMKTCSDCHQTAHDQALVPSVPASIPLNPAFEWSLTLPTSTFGTEYWMPAEYVVPGARMVLSSRVQTSAPTVWSWYSAQMSAQGWLIDSGAPSGTYDSFTTTWAKPGQHAIIWCYGGEDHMVTPVSAAGLRIEIAYYAD